MLIQFTKHSGRPHTLKCAREDGTSTCFKSGNNADFFVLHDLTHYAVETVMGYQHAFWGMIAGGRDFDSFGSEAADDPGHYEPEALYTENIVGTLMQVGFEAPFKDFEQAMTMIYPEGGPAMGKGEYEQMQRLRSELVGRWRALPAEETLTLEFPKKHEADVEGLRVDDR